MTLENVHSDTLAAVAVSVVRGGLTFRVVPACQEQLFGPDAPDWTDPSGDDRAELVKSNPRRTIWRVRYNDLDVHVKRYELGGLVGSLKNLFRRSPVASEFQNLQLAHSLGVAAPEPLAFGQKGLRGMAGPSVLITATVPDAQPLTARLGRKPMDEEIVALLAELLGRLHLAGRTHPDLHLANLSVSKPPDGRRKLYIFDLQKLPRIPPARLDRQFEILPSKAKWHLACDYIRFSRKMTDCQRQKFLRTYLRTIEPGLIVEAAKLDQMLAEIRQLGLQDVRRRWAKRDSRASGTNKYFARIRLADGWAGSVLLRRTEHVPGGLTSVSQFTPQQWCAALADPLKLFADEGSHKVEQSNQPITVRRRLQVGSTTLNVQVALRRTAPEHTGCLQNIPVLWRRPHARHDYETGFALLRRFIPTVLPLAWLRRRDGLFAQSSILITEVMPETVGHSDFLADLTGTGQGDFAQLRELASHAGALAGELVSSGFVHFDFQPANILMQRTPDGQSRLLLLGLEHVHRCGAGSSRPLKMLARAYLAVRTHPALTRMLRLRFLLTYLKHVSQPSANWKHHWREIDRLAQNVALLP